MLEPLDKVYAEDCRTGLVAVLRRGGGASYYRLKFRFGSAVTPGIHAVLAASIARHADVMSCLTSKFNTQMTELSSASLSLCMANSRFGLSTAAVKHFKPPTPQSKTEALLSLVILRPRGVYKCKSASLQKIAQSLYQHTVDHQFW